LALLAPVVLAILDLAERLLPTVHWDCRDPKLLLLRAAVATITADLFFSRGECSARALVDDIVINDTHITLLLRKEKGKKNLGEGHMNSRQVPCYKVPRVAAMLAAFFTRQGIMGQRRRRWALSLA
jgi:hypothetical protein